MQARYAIAGFLSIVLGASYMLVQNWTGLVAFSDILFVLASGCAAFLAYLSAIRVGLKGQFAPVRCGLFLGVFFWFVGELTWTIYELALNVEVPYPSFADVFYLAGYVSMIIGTVNFLLNFRQALTRRRALAALATGLAIAGLTFVVLLQPLSESPHDILTRAFNLAYPSLDAILIFLAISIFFVYEGGLLAEPWIWISIGLILTALADVMLNLGTLEGWYASGNPVELPYLWGYIAMGLGFEMQRTVF